MSLVPWAQEINFGSALLLHSCITIFLKEISNRFTILYILADRHRNKADSRPPIVLDGYTSVFSRDHRGELVELYFTNTGFVLLIVSLALAIPMNLHLPTTALNVIIATTFGLTFLASALVACRKKSLVMPVMALRRAGRFIRPDTPFIAILELVFMKANLEASSADIQQTMLERLIDKRLPDHAHCIAASKSRPHRLFQKPTTPLCMLYKTTIGHADGSLCGGYGPVRIKVPRDVGFFIDESEDLGWRIYRISSDLLLIEDCVQVMIKKFQGRAPTKERRGVMPLVNRIEAWTHGVLLRRLGRRRVVWVSKIEGKGTQEDCWKGNVNIVTGLKASWLHNRQKFTPVVDYEGDNELICYVIVR